MQAERKRDQESAKLEADQQIADTTRARKRAKVTKAPGQAGTDSSLIFFDSMHTIGSAIPTFNLIDGKPEGMKNFDTPAILRMTTFTSDASAVKNDMEAMATKFKEGSERTSPGRGQRKLNAQAEKALEDRITEILSLVLATGDSGDVTLYTQSSEVMAKHPVVKQAAMI